MIADKKAKDRARRLRLLRERVHKVSSQRQFAARLGVDYSRYNHWECGWPIPEEQVRKIKEITPGITGDWLFWGDERGLTVEMLKKLS